MSNSTQGLKSCKYLELFKEVQVESCAMKLVKGMEKN